MDTNAKILIYLLVIIVAGVGTISTTTSEASAQMQQQPSKSDNNVDKATPVLIPKAIMPYTGGESTMLLRSIIINNKTVVQISPPTYYYASEFSRLEPTDDIVFALCSCDTSNIQLSKNPEAKISAVTITPFLPRAGAFTYSNYTYNLSYNSTSPTSLYYESDIKAPALSLKAFSPGKYTVNVEKGTYLLNVYILYPTLGNIVAIYSAPINISPTINYQVVS